MASAGVSRSIINMPTRTVTGNDLTLEQIATGEAGADATIGRSGIGGNALSVLEYDDSLQATPFSSITTQVTAVGGSGGSAKDDLGIGKAFGGDGGKATADTSIKGSGSLSVVSDATGGSGGAGDGLKFSGNGGVAQASAKAISTNGNDVSVTAKQVGGKGGDGATDSIGNGANGGNGASSSMTNAVSGMTDGGTLFLTQDAVGGAAGNGGQSNGKSGLAGSATSNLAFDDTQQATRSLSIVVLNSASGGEGGVSGYQSYNGGFYNSGGGTALAVTHVEGDGTINVTSLATGGDASIGDPNHFDVPFHGGVGGTAHAEASGNSRGLGYNVTVTAVQIGGDGGGGTEVDGGGSGAGSYINSAVSGMTNQGLLTLNQTATGGRGATFLQFDNESSSGFVMGGGAGGVASSTLNLDDTTLGRTSSIAIDVTNLAIAGNGGEAFLEGADGGNGGSAKATSIIKGAREVTLSVSAHGGAGGRSYDTIGGDGGSAVSDALGLSATTHAGDQVNVTSVATGGDGGAILFGDKSGSGGSATASARAVSSGAVDAFATARALGGAGGTGESFSPSGGNGGSATVTGATGQTNRGTLTLDELAVGGDGGAGVGGDAISTLNNNDPFSKKITATISARGGNGGDASQIEGKGLDGGSATANAAIVALGDVSLKIDATGGSGGAGNQGPGGIGGESVSHASAISSSGSVSVSAIAYGSDAGGSTGDAGYPGVDGSASTASAFGSSNSASDVLVFVAEYGGNASSGVGHGGAGASVDMVDAVSGSTRGGHLTLTQEAHAGNGGDGGLLPGFGDGGNGGNAISNLGIDDLHTLLSSAEVTGNVVAVGGIGADVGYTEFGNHSGDGGDATASISILGAHDVVAVAMATGGNSGQVKIFSPSAPLDLSHGGSASATSSAVAADTASASATAHGGASVAMPGDAIAAASATAPSGSVHAFADTTLLDGETTYVQSSSDAIVFENSTAQAIAKFGSDLTVETPLDQAFAFIVGNPSKAAVDASLSGNVLIQEKLVSADTFYFVAGDLGAASATGGLANTYTQTSHAAFSVDLEKTPNAQHELFLGFYNPQVTGTIDSLILDVSNNGKVLLHQVFGDVVAAESYLQDHALDLGALSGASANISIDLSVTSAAQHHGSVYFDFVAGGGMLA